MWGAARPEARQERGTDRWLVDGRPPHAFEVWGDGAGLAAFLAEDSARRARQRQAQHLRAAQRAAACVLHVGLTLGLATLGVAALRRHAA